ncbi:hypothetical protein NSPZN2_150036 [Nitrospira defluvii]|uniref:Transposase n=1 Tax=Nitrospira defluvii TaxID=330214 RepID=A0ABM8RAF7_9BACT|nr:hypothetical protein NSPZN2_150036 [Nitrospira defluvii]
MRSTAPLASLGGGEGGKYLGARLWCWFKESGYGQPVGQPTWQNRLTKAEKQKSRVK